MGSSEGGGEVVEYLFSFFAFLVELARMGCKDFGIQSRRAFRLADLSGIADVFSECGVNHEPETTNMSSLPCRVLSPPILIAADFALHEAFYVSLFYHFLCSLPSSNLSWLGLRQKQSQWRGK